MQSLRLPCILLFSCYHGSLSTGNRLVSCYLYPSYLCYKDVEGASTPSSSSATAELTAKYEKMRLWSIYWIVVERSSERIDGQAPLYHPEVIEGGQDLSRWSAQRP